MTSFQLILNWIKIKSCRQQNYFFLNFLLGDGPGEPEPATMAELELDEVRVERAGSFRIASVNDPCDSGINLRLGLAAGLLASGTVSDEPAVDFELDWLWDDPDRVLRLDLGSANSAKRRTELDETDRFCVVRWVDKFSIQCDQLAGYFLIFDSAWPNWVIFRH